MPNTPQQLPRTLWIGFGLLLGVVGVMYLLSLAEVSRARKSPLPVLNPIAGFTLTNQNDQAETLAGLTNHVWVADIIFTRCASSCPIMTGQMKSLQDALPPASGAKLVTLTTDPDYDTPEILKRYGERYKADFNRWTFLTGTKKELAGLATGSLKLGSTPVMPKDQKDAVDLFVHSTIFVIVDKQARLRGIFQTEGEGVDWTKIKPQILAAVKQLENGG